VKLNNSFVAGINNDSSNRRKRNKIKKTARGEKEYAAMPADDKN